MHSTLLRHFKANSVISLLSFSGLKSIKLMKSDSIDRPETVPTIRQNFFSIADISVSSNIQSERLTALINSVLDTKTDIDSKNSKLLLLNGMLDAKVVKVVE